MNEHIETARRIIKGGDRVRIGYTLNDTRAVTDPDTTYASAEDAEIAIRTAYSVAESIGAQVTDFTVWRRED